MSLVIDMVVWNLLEPTFYNLSISIHKHLFQAQSSVGSSNVNTGPLYRGSEQQTSATFSQTTRSVAPVAVFIEASETLNLK